MTPIEVEQMIAHIEIGNFDERLSDVSRAVTMRQLLLNQENAARKAKQDSDVLALEIDVLVRDVLIQHEKDSTDIKNLSNAVYLFREARKMGRADLARKIGTTLFNMSDDQVAALPAVVPN